MKRSYRADIDGLRAVAVATILLFHAGFGGFSGGFTGVDVFFVISGYLITGQIALSIERGTFSFLEFYERRIRRLMPAALATFIGSALIACFLLTPEQLTDFGASLAASIGWTSNIFFWHSTGYFDLDAHTKPLLHIWSLSVEEQFYLVWPLFLILVGQRSRGKAFIAVAVVSAMSLLACKSDLFDPSAVFYLMPFRIAEFGVGAMLALPRRLPTTPMLSEVAVIAGLIIIAFVTYRFTDDMVFPGFAAMVPCAGAALLIYGGEARFAGLLLRNSLSVWLGRISYSVYLVHWPIIVFYRIVVPGDVSPSAKAGIVISSLVLGYFLYLLVETPFRQGAKSQWFAGRGKFFSAFAAAIILIGVPALSMRFQGGWEWRYPLEFCDQMKVNLDKDLAWANLRSLNQPFTDSSLPKVLIIGDSQAGDFLNTVLAAHADAGVEIRTEVIQSECQAIIPRSAQYYSGRKPPLDRNCRDYHEHLKSSAKIEMADIVVLASNWQLFGLPEINNTVEYSLSHGVKRVFVVGRKDQGLSGQALLRKYWDLNGIEKISSEFRSDEAVNINAMLKADLRKATYVDLMSIACPVSTYCNVVTPERKVIFSDIMHFTRPGTDYMAALYKDNGIFQILDASAVLMTERTH